MNKNYKKCVQTHVKLNTDFRLNYVASNHPGFGDSRTGNAASYIAFLN